MRQPSKDPESRAKLFYRSHASASSNSNNGQASSRLARPEVGKRWICRFFNSGTCTKELSHINNGLTYDVFYSFCNVTSSAFLKLIVKQKGIRVGGSAPSTI